MQARTYPARVFCTLDELKELIDTPDILSQRWVIDFDNGVPVGNTNLKIFTDIMLAISFPEEISLAIYLDRNELDDTNIDELKRLLANVKFPKDSQLSLKSNKITSKGFIQLIDGLEKNVNLTGLHLWLRNNNIDDEGAEYLGNKLTQGITPKDIYIYLESNRHISELGALHILLGLCDSHPSQRVNVSCTPQIDSMFCKREFNITGRALTHFANGVKFTKHIPDEIIEMILYYAYPFYIINEDGARLQKNFIKNIFNAAIHSELFFKPKNNNNNTTSEESFDLNCKIT